MTYTVSSGTLNPTQLNSSVININNRYSYISSHCVIIGCSLVLCVIGVCDITVRPTVSYSQLRQMCQLLTFCHPRLTYISNF